MNIKLTYIRRQTINSKAHFFRKISKTVGIVVAIQPLYPIFVVYGWGRTSVTGCLQGFYKRYYSFFHIRPVAKGEFIEQKFINRLQKQWDHAAVSYTQIQYTLSNNR